jgi:sulfite exporter TauE/SafE
MGVSFGSVYCLASCGPLFLSYVSGTGKNVAKALVSYLIFSLARITVYVFLGVLVYCLGKFFAETIFEGISKYVFILGGGFITCIGILMALGRNMDTAVCRVAYKNLLEKDIKSIFLFGLIIGLLPCPPLFALFSYLALISKSLALSAVYAFAFGVGTLLSPLALLPVFAGVIPRALLKVKPVFSRIFNLICAAIMIFLGIQLVRRGF